MIDISTPTIRRTAAAVNARRYAIACVCLLIVAASLRFYNLQGRELIFDEARAAVNSTNLSEVIDNTRTKNSSPILYPIALWAVQRVSASEFSIRLAPAAASLLTVAALLFMMPRVGVARRAAFLAALLAAVSVAAIEHAQHAREYSLDALVAVLMIAGLLQYLRDGKTGLLCVSLFAAPLLQYGLVLFGAAALAAAAVAPAASHTCAHKERLAYHKRIGRRLRARIDLLLPIAYFATACAISWEITTRHQWAEGVEYRSGSTRYLANYYYQGAYEAAAVVEFAISRTWGMLSYHMPIALAAAALLGFAAVAAVALMRGRRVDALGLLALFAVGGAVGAALVSAYPFGGIRQCLYLGPLVFLVAGSAFHSLVGDIAALARREWLAGALGIAVAGAIALAGAVEIRQRNEGLYYSDPSMRQALAALDELAQRGDAVYVSTWEAVHVKFFKRAKPDGYFYGSVFCSGDDWTHCVQEMLDEAFMALNNSRRIWLIHNASVSVPKEAAAYSQELVVEEVATGGRQRDVWAAPHDVEPPPPTTLHLVTGLDGLVREKWRHAESGALIAAANYNLYLQGNTLYYAKQPCAPSDTEARFFLHIYPADAADLPDAFRDSGFENLDFRTRDYEFFADDKCIVWRALPEYAIGGIHTGQFVDTDGAIIWEVEAPFAP